MTQPTTIAFKDFVIYLGDGATPTENFTKAPLAMTTRGFQQQLKSTTITVPDQDNEDAVVADQERGDTISRDASGKGTLGTADHVTWQAWFDSGVAKNVKVVLNGVGYWLGPALLTGYNLTGQRTNVVEADVAIKASDNWPFTASA